MMNSSPDIDKIVRYILLLRKDVIYDDPESGNLRRAFVKEVVVDITFSVHLTLMFKDAKGKVLLDVPPVWVYDLDKIKEIKTDIDRLVEKI